MIKFFGVIIMWESVWKTHLYLSQVVGYRKAEQNMKSFAELKLDEELIGKHKCLTQ